MNSKRREEILREAAGGNSRWQAAEIALSLAIPPGHVVVKVERLRDTLNAIALLITMVNGGEQHSPVSDRAIDPVTEWLATKLKEEE